MGNEDGFSTPPSTRTDGQLRDFAGGPLDSRKAVYAGSFDPPTNGHLYIIKNASKLFDELFVAVGVNPNKRPAFTHDQRVAMLRACVADLPNVHVLHFSNEYLVHFAARQGAAVIVRGIRTFIDYDFEHRMRQMNSDIDDRVTTVFLMPPRNLAELSSSFVKGLIGPSGWEQLVRRLVPEPVFQELRAYAERTGAVHDASAMRVSGEE